MNSNEEMLDHYDFRGAVRGKYYQQYKAGTNVVLLEPDLAEVFPDSSSVNKALRRYLSDHGKPRVPKKRVSR